MKYVRKGTSCYIEETVCLKEKFTMEYLYLTTPYLIPIGCN